MLRKAVNLQLRKANLSFVVRARLTFHVETLLFSLNQILSSAVPAGIREQMVFWRKLDSSD